jgi:hypothetical protein
MLGSGGIFMGLEEEKAEEVSQSGTRNEGGGSFGPRGRNNIMYIIV